MSFSLPGRAVKQTIQYPTRIGGTSDRIAAQHASTARLSMASRSKRRDPQFLYLTTIGRVTSKLREIEIWYVARGGRFYVFAEGFRNAHWVRNVQRNPRVNIELGDRSSSASARVLEENRDRELWREVRELARAKYDWGDGLPVEITPDVPIEEPKVARR
jgi:deazaflavin-dependent oxidoreductase (nitroreductase family)